MSVLRSATGWGLKPAFREPVRLHLSVREISGWSGARNGLAAALDGVHGTVLTGQWAGGGALVLAEPIRTVLATDDPFQVLDELPPQRAAWAHPGAVGGGWFGYLGFEAGTDAGLTARRQRQGSAGADVATSYWALYPNLIRFESATGRWYDEALIGLVDDEELEQRRQVLTGRVQEATAASASVASAPVASARRARDSHRALLSPLRSTTTQSDHLSAVTAVQEHISAGDIYQVNLCLSLAASVTGRADAAFDVLTDELEPKYGAFLSGAFAADRHGDGTHNAVRGSAALVSASPELFLRRRGRAVTSAPIKGTRPRPADAAAAAVEARRLRHSEKDRAENVMITDLVRNDLSRVAEVGSVEVPVLLRLESHPGVWHLVSEVRARLLPQTSDADLLRATFPPGSVTGAPKIRALEIIAELESRRRGPYTGAIGYVSPIAGLELSVAIRTVIVAGGEAALGVGGGITADSQAQEEWWECFDKARALATALGSGIDVAGATRPNVAGVPVVAEVGARRS